MALENQFTRKSKKNYPVCKNLFKVKNIYSRQRLLQFILLPLCALCRFSHAAYLQHASELPNWDKSDKIFKQIILVTSKAEEKIQKLYFYFFCNFDENMRRPPEKDPPRIRKVIKNTNQNYLSWLLGNGVPGKGTYLPLKSNEIKYFYELVKEDSHCKSMKIMIESLKVMMQDKSKEKMDYRRLFSRYCDSNLTPWN